jgi:hypothetical protein
MLKQETEAVLNENLPVLQNASVPDQKQSENRCNVSCNMLGALSVRK